MGPAAEFRRYARRYVERSRRADGYGRRIVLLATANKWLNLAEQAQREAELMADDRDLKPEVH